MVRALRITSVIVVIVAVVLLILPAVFGVRSDPQIEEFLKTPDSVEKFTVAKDQRPAKDESQTSPLVRQAASFARYLNPPPPRAAAQSEAPAQPQAAPMGPVSAKFNLIGTSFYATNPQMSLALIDEPGKGLNWVRQGNTVGHLTIEQIKDGSITVRDGARTSEMTVKVQESWRNLLKNPPPETRPVSISAESSGIPAVASGDTGAVETNKAAMGPRGAGPGAAGTGPVARRPPMARKTDLAALRAAAEQIAAMRRSRTGAEVPGPQLNQGKQGVPGPNEPGGGRQRAVRQHPAAKSKGSSKVTPDEAARMEQLAEMLKKLGAPEDANSGPPASPPDGQGPEPNLPPPADANQ